MDEPNLELPHLPVRVAEVDTKAGTVAYGRPPVWTQFKPRQSGNAAGRPPGSRNKPPVIGHKDLQHILSKAFDRKITLKDGGRTRRVTMLDAAIHTLTLKAVKGDFRSLQLMIDEQRAIEARQVAEWNAILTVVRWYKDHAYAELARCAAEGREPIGFFCTQMPYTSILKR